MNIEVASRNNTFIEYLRLFAWFDNDRLKAMMDQYSISATAKGEPIFWHINAEKKITNGHIITMDKVTGKIYDSSWHYLDGRPMCLFGEHLIATFPDRPVALVRDEMTAVIMSCFPTPYVWLATGMDISTSADLTFLKGKKVVIFPDKGEYGNCKEKLNVLPFYISDVMEQSQGNFHNMAQVILSNQPMRPTKEEIALRQLEESNPDLTNLIDALGLVVAGVAESEVEEGNSRRRMHTPLASNVRKSAETLERIRVDQEARWNGRNLECHQCKCSHEGINGTYCDKLQKYVEYGKGSCERRACPML